MLAKDLAELLLKTPDVEVTICVFDGDYTDENEVDDVTDWDSFVSIQHSRKR